MSFSALLKDSQGIPISQVYIPGVGFIALEGSTVTNNDGSNTSTGVMVAQLGTWTVQPGNTANTTAWKVDGSAVTQPISGSVIQGLGATAGVAWRTMGDYNEYASLSAGSLNADLVASTDVNAFKWLSLHINTSAYSGTLTFQASNDNTNWVSLMLYRIDTASVGQAFTSTALTNVIFAGPVTARYFRVRMTAYTSGTAQGTLELYTQPPAYAALVVSTAQSGTWTVQPGNTANTTPWLVSQSGSDVTVLASAAQTTTQTQADQTNVNAKGVRVVLDVTNAGTGSITLEIDAKDVASGKYVALLTGAAVTSNSTNVYVVYPGLTPSANAIASDVLSHTWRVKVTANNANSITYSVGASLLT